MEIKFWGTRGTIATPGDTTVIYGGNTSCISVKLKNNYLIILDAGTGIRNLGISLLKSDSPIEGHILLSHFHWDHIEGLPFFTPLYKKGNKFTITGSFNATHNIKDIILDPKKMNFFPVNFEQIKSELVFIENHQNIINIKDCVIQFTQVNHPEEGMAFRIKEEGKTFVYMTDNELSDPTISFDKFVRFCRDADLLIHDAQFTPEELKRKKGWGHSSYKEALELAIQANVKQLCLFHHDPEHSDIFIDEIIDSCIDTLREKDINIICFAAQEGLELTI